MFARSIILVPLIALVGCENLQKAMPTNPSSQWTAAAKVYHTTANALATLHEGGLLSDEQLIAFDEPMSIAFRTLIEAEDMLTISDQGSVAKTELVLQIIQSVRRRLYAETGQELN